MCIRVQYAACHLLDEPYDDTQLVITLPAGLQEAYALAALREVLTQLDVAQPESGARCWCGEPIRLLPRVPQQRRSDEVIHLA